MAKLTAKKRNALSGSTFAGPDRSYPIPDASHARNALSRVSQFGSPDLKAAVRAKVAKKFPGIGKMDGGRAASRLDRSPRKSGGEC
jgi:hypothetical protein